MQLPISGNSVQSSLNNFFQSLQLNGENRYFCPICSSLQSVEEKYNLMSLGNYLVIQVKRFTFQLNTSLKDISFINSSAPLSVPIFSNDEVSVNKIYQLCAVVNHSGTLNSGHYWSVVSHSSN